MAIGLIAYLTAVTGLSLAAFAAYGWDKWRASSSGWRVSERSLHLLALLGGWPGAFAGQQVFRHKTRKLGFRMITWLACCLHIGVLGVAAWLLLA